MVKKFSLKKEVFLTIVNCDGFTKEDASSHGKGMGQEEYALRWKRGDKKENQGETTFKLVSKKSLSVDWNETFTISQCTFFYTAESPDPSSSKNYFEKLIDFTLVRRLAPVEGESEEEARKRRGKGTLVTAVGKINLASLFAGKISAKQTKMIELETFQKRTKEHILCVEIKVVDQ